MQPSIRPRLILTGVVLLSAFSLFAQAYPTTGYADIDIALARLEGLPLDEFFEASFRELLLRDPERVTALGLSGYYGVRDDRLTDISPEYIAATQALERGVLELLRTYNDAQLSSEEAVYHATYKWFLDDLVRLHPYVYYT
jgi:uncharacterized protein (DUF885 family)